MGSRLQTSLPEAVIGLRRHQRCAGDKQQQAVPCSLALVPDAGRRLDSSSLEWGVADGRSVAVLGAKQNLGEDWVRVTLRVLDPG